MGRVSLDLSPAGVEIHEHSNPDKKRVFRLRDVENPRFFAGKGATGTCFSMRESAGLNHLILCPPSIRLRNFWMTMITQAILGAKIGDGGLYLEPDEVDDTKAKSSEEEDEEKEINRNALYVEIEPQQSANGIPVYPKIELDGEELPIEASGKSSKVNLHEPKKADPLPKSIRRKFEAEEVPSLKEHDLRNVPIRRALEKAQRVT